jgi:hypothetical protein
MSRRAWIAWGGLAVLVLAGIAAAVLAGGSGEAQGSAVSRGPSGWLAARRFLEARGAAVTLWRRPLAGFTGRGVLVLTFPWQHGELLETAGAIDRHLQRGGDVVLAWSGGSGNAGETLALEELGLTPEEVRKAPLNPFVWRRFVREEWDLRPAVPAGEGKAAAPLRIWAPRQMPELPQAPEVLYRTPAGEPAVVRLRRHRGSLWLLPADALANARLGQAGNADLLETLHARLGGPWTFDEYHHGLVAIDVEAGASRRTFDLVLFHLGLLYALAVLTLARRFGPPWKEAPVVAGSVGSFLVGLGALHHRLRHHRDAAERLLERTRELSPDLALPDDLARRAADAGPRELVELARDVVRLRRRDHDFSGD